MGLALAAELNGNPGPSHVLELAGKLDLSADQRVRFQELLATMKQDAMPLGSKLLEQEAELDKQFAKSHHYAGESQIRDHGGCSYTRRAACEMVALRGERR